MNELFNINNGDNLLERIEDKVMENDIDNMTSSFTEKDNKELSLKKKKKIAREELDVLYMAMKTSAPTIRERKQIKALYKRAKNLLK